MKAIAFLLLIVSSSVFVHSSSVFDHSRFIAVREKRTCDNCELAEIVKEENLKRSKTFNDLNLFLLFNMHQGHSVLKKMLLELGVNPSVEDYMPMEAYLIKYLDFISDKLTKKINDSNADIKQWIIDRETKIVGQNSSQEPSAPEELPRAACARNDTPIVDTPILKSSFLDHFSGSDGIVYVFAKHVGLESQSIKDLCQSLRGNIPMPKTPQHIRSLLEYYNKMGFKGVGWSSNMIGLSRVNNIVRWDDGTAFNPSVYGNLVSFTDRGSSPKFIMTYHKTYFEIADRDHKTWPLCKIEDTTLSNAPFGDYFYGSDGNFYFFAKHVSMSSQGIKDLCQSIKGNIPMPKTPLHIRSLLEYYKKMGFKGDGKNFNIIGLSRVNNIVQWDDGTAFNPFVYGNLVSFVDDGSKIYFRVVYYATHFVIEGYESTSWPLCQIFSFQ